MSIDFIGPRSLGQIGSLKKSQNTQASKTDKAAGDDKVNFSSVLQDVHKAQAAGKTTSSERTERIQELKAQIDNGTYEPDLNKVSASLMKFLVESE